MVEILKYNQNMKNEWDSFVSESFNGTLFHKRNFYHIILIESLMIAPFYLKKGENNCNNCSSYTSLYKNKKILSSHPGASFGGIVHKNISFDDCEKIVELLNHFAEKTLMMKYLWFKLHQYIIKINQNELVDYVMKINAYDDSEYYISNVLNIEKNIDGQISKIIKNKNRTVNYYEKLVKKYNITFKWVENFDEFYPILIKK